MHFYDKYVALCKTRDVSPSRAAIDMGMDKSTVSVWKSKKIKGEDVKPSTPVIDKMVEYFGVSADYLLGIDDLTGDTKKPATISDDGLAEINSIFLSLDPDNRAKLLELAHLYFASQRKNEEKQ